MRRSTRMQRPARGVVALALAVLLLSACAGSESTPSSEAPVSGTASTPVALAPDELAARFGDAVWRVEVDGCGIESGGTAFAIAADTFVTNQHVVVFDATPTLVSRDGRTLEGQVIGMRADPDLAIIRVDGTVDTFLAWVPTAELREGQAVVALGYPAPLYRFTVSPGTLNAFDVVDGVRTAILSDEASDFGSSGGPLLALDGRVAGIVTSFSDGTERQSAGLSLTFDVIATDLAEILADGAPLDEDCVGSAYGSDPVLDILWDWCDEGRMWACDELYLMAEAGSDYEWFGDSCGERNEPDDWCTLLYDTPEAFEPGDDDELDRILASCLAATSDASDASDLCFLVIALAPEGSEYSSLADGCLARLEAGRACTPLR
jgi:hypothetical protein